MNRTLLWLILVFPLRGICQQVHSIQIGRMAPKFALPNQEAKLVKLTDFRGYYVLLNFRAGGDQASRATQSVLSDFYNEFNPTGRLVILSVSLDKENGAWLKTTAKDKPLWIQLVDLNSSGDKVAKLYEVGSMPANYLIDYKGRLLSRNATKEFVRETLKIPKPTQLNGLTIAQILHKMSADGIKEEDVKEDFKILKAILETDIGELALHEEMRSLASSRDRARIDQVLLEKAVHLSIQKMRMTQKFIEAHPDSYVSLSRLADMDSDYTVDGYVSAYDGLTDRLKKTKLAAEIREKIKRSNGTPTGTLATNFTRKDQYGKTVSLSDYKGKLVLLDFWGSWCVPCRIENKHIKPLYEKYKGKGLEIVSVAVEDGKTLAEKQATWLAAIKKDDIHWVHVLNDEGTKAANIANQYGIQAYPTKILLDRDGKVLMRVTGGSNNEMDKLIESMLDK